jgi:DNA replication protein DnaC
MERMGDILARTATRRRRGLRSSVSGRAPSEPAGDLPRTNRAATAPSRTPSTRHERSTGTGQSMRPSAATTALPDVLENDQILEFARPQRGSEAVTGGDDEAGALPAVALPPRQKSRARRSNDPVVCPTCGGAGYVRMDVPLGDPAFGKPVPCQCREREWEERRRLDLRRFSSLDPFYDKTFDSFNSKAPGMREAYDAARRFAEDPQGWLVLRGGYGCGKTHLAAAIANAHLAAGAHVFFSIVPDLLDHLRAAFAPGSEIRYDEMFERVREAGLLVLDDLGAENGTAWATEKLFQIINYRYNFRMPTVITTNNRLLSHMDERLASRLSDIGLVQTIVLEAPDYRKRHTAAASRQTPGGQRGRAQA